MSYNINHKPATTYDQQIELLEKRGLIISNKEKTLDTLSSLNYYTITGYLHNFKCDNDDYIKGITFDKIYNIINFDRRFRNILIYNLEIIESTIKTKISYNLAHDFGPMGYLKANNFKNKYSHDFFIDLLEKNKEKNKNLSFIKHHNKKYGGMLPIWVASEIFTLGMVYNLYKNIPTKNQKQIASEFNTGPNQLSSWLENIVYIRNMIAHYMRIYNFNLQKTPAQCKKNHVFTDTTHKIFDVIYIMKFLTLNEEEWNTYIINNIELLFQQYKNHIDIKCLGFPNNWKEILVK